MRRHDSKFPEGYTLWQFLLKNVSKDIKNPYRLPPVLQPDPPPGWHGSLRSDVLAFFEAQVSGSWHDHVPGETRMHID